MCVTAAHLTWKCNWLPGNHFCHPQLDLSSNHEVSLIHNGTKSLDRLVAVFQHSLNCASNTYKEICSHRPDSNGQLTFHSKCASSFIYIYAFTRHFYPKRLTMHSGYTFVLSVCVFPGNRTHNLCAANTMLYHWATETRIEVNTLCITHQLSFKKNIPVIRWLRSKLYNFL